MYVLYLYNRFNRVFTLPFNSSQLLIFGCLCFVPPGRFTHWPTRRASYIHSILNSLRELMCQRMGMNYHDRIECEISPGHDEHT